MNIEKITNMAHFTSYERKIRDISPFTINNELVMVYTWWQDHKNWVVFTRSLQYLPAKRR
jgi:hypothetical protein